MILGEVNLGGTANPANPQPSPPLVAKETIPGQRFAWSGRFKVAA